MRDETFLFESKIEELRARKKTTHLLFLNN